MGATFSGSRFRLRVLVNSEKKRGNAGLASATWVKGQCLCGNVELEIDFPVRWAWHDHAASAAIRSFCVRCGTPLTYERHRSPTMVNIPRALFTNRTGREPLYHLAIEELQEWTYTGEALVPLKGFPGVVWTRPKKRKKRVEMDDLL